MSSIHETVALHHTPLSRMFRGDPLARWRWKLGVTPVRTAMIVFTFVASLVQKLLVFRF